MSTHEALGANDGEDEEEDALEELTDEYADVVSELARQDSPLAERLRRLRDGGES